MDGINNGWIKLHRKIKDCWIWEEKPFSKGQAWIDLLLSANHKGTKLPFNGEIIKIERGQIVTSTRKLSDRWGWSKNTVTNFLKLLESDRMIVKDSDKHRTLITIENYGVYQDCGDTEGTPTDHQLTTEGTPTDHQLTTNKNDKNIKNDKNVKNNINIYTRGFEDFWKAYPRKKDKGNAFKKFNARLKSGFSEAELIEAAIKYAYECQKDNTPEKYIKYAQTFLSDSTPFIEYLNKDYEKPSSTSNDDLGLEDDELVGDDW